MSARLLKLGPRGDATLRGGLASKRGELQLEDAVENRCGVLLLESGGRRVEVRGKALAGAENARLMRKAGERE